MRLRVTHTKSLTPSIRLIRLEDPDQLQLPSFDAGAHVELNFDIGGHTVSRKYSLVSDINDRTGYDIAVKRNSGGRGGSEFLHETLAIGSELEVSEPLHEFSIARDAKHHILIAGGVGITPMLNMASLMENSGESYELHYSAKSSSDMAFHDMIIERHQDSAFFYFTAQNKARRLDVEELLDAHRNEFDTHVYVCGPTQLIDRVRLAAAQRDVKQSRIHFESFGPSWASTDGKVHLSLSESSIDLEVAPGTTLLDAMESAGAWIASDCRRGECGACIVSYTSGKPIHRDNCLTAEQREHSFCPCVSWASPEEPLRLQI